MVYARCCTRFYRYNIAQNRQGPCSHRDCVLVNKDLPETIKSICSVLGSDKCYEKSKGKGVRMVKGGSAILDKGRTILDTDFLNRQVSR